MLPEVESAPAAPSSSTDRPPSAGPTPGSDTITGPPADAGTSTSTGPAVVAAEPSGRTRSALSIFCHLPAPSRKLSGSLPMTVR